MYRHCILFAVIILSLFSLSPAFPETAAETISFSWALIYKTADGVIKTIDPDAGTVVLPSDAELKIYVKPIKNVYIYLLLEESTGELFLAFPARLKDITAVKTVMIGKDFYAPAKPENWLGLDQVQGTLKVYIFASKNRLEKLESLLAIYFDPKNIMDIDSDDAKEARQKVVEEMKRIRLENASAKTVKTGPVPVAGNFREKEGKLEFDAIVVEAESFYAKTVRIDH